MPYALLSLLLCLLVGCGTPSLLITPVANTNALREEMVVPGRGWFPDKIAIVDVEGVLLNARTGGFLQPQENKVSLFLQQLNAAAGDDSVKAVVLRVNSPGGTVTAADTMYQMVMDFRKTTGKPVIASTQDITASGAYYIVCGADQIVAHPTSVIGSIGVIFNTLDAADGLAKLGIAMEAIKSGRFKDMGSPFKHISPDERAIMQGMVDQYFQRFVDVVTSNRRIAGDDLATVTDGRVFTGVQAVQLGLADMNGTLDDAIQLARQVAQAPNASVVLYKRPYGYGGTIYADTSSQPPRADVLRLEVPGLSSLMPTGFYYLWRP